MKRDMKGQTTKVYTDQEVRKMWSSFIDFLTKNKIPTCNVLKEIYQAAPIEVILMAQEIKKEN